MKLALDVMGFENETNEAILAARAFVKNHNCEIILVGDEKIIKPLLLPIDNKLSIFHAEEFVTMDDLPISALRKSKTSMYQAINLVKDHKADGVLSAGSTSCFVPLVHFLLKPLSSVKTLGFMPFIPTTNNVGFNMIDVGANINVDGTDLYNYAKMANIYVRDVRKIKSPKIGVLNIGTEHHKGYEFHHEADKLLSNDKSLNYVGFVESKLLLKGIVDIVVCDGYAGNLTLKALEGSLYAVSDILKKGFKKPQNWLGAIFSLGVIKKLKKTFDYKNNAGAMVLGANGVAIKTHGSADQKQFYSSLRMLYEVVEAKIIDKIIGLTHA